MKNKNEYRSLLPKRTRKSNKTDFGNSLIIGGDEKHLGAAILAALSCTISGSGYTHLMSDLNRFPWIKYPDFILHKFKISELKNKINYGIGIGPGLGFENKKLQILNYLLKNNYERVVVDADALTLIKKLKIKKLPKDWILTPHEGELGKLLNVNSKQVKGKRLKFALLAHKRFGCHILLKGSDTILIDCKGKHFQMKCGTPALAKAGSGDVLTGIITSFRSQNLNSIDSMKLGVYIHGMAAKLFLKNGFDESSLRPVNIIENIPIVIKKLR